LRIDIDSVAKDGTGSADDGQAADGASKNAALFMLLMESFLGFQRTHHN